MEDNCVMQIFDHSKQILSLKFWFGGRVKTEKFDISKVGIKPAEKVSTQ
jgi:hypothetical protein